MAHLFTEMKRLDSLRECISKRMSSNQCFKFQALPCNVKQNVIFFLSTSDTLHLIQTCKSMLPECSLSKASSQLRVLGSANKTFEGGFVTRGRPQCFCAVVPKHMDQLHSITFQCDWVDQGWGDREGKLYIVAQSRPEDFDPSDYAKVLNLLPFADGRIVAESPLVQHRKTFLAMAFYPKPDEVYQLWCKRGVGEQVLNLENMTLHRFGFGSNLLPDYVVYHFDLSIDDTSFFFHMNNLAAPSAEPSFQTNNLAALYPVPPFQTNYLASQFEESFHFERFLGVSK
jgi:hypothetical protein